jgi:hypothetical protein
VTDLFVLLFQLSGNLIAIPVHLQTKLYLAFHLCQHVAQRIVSSANQLNNIFFGAEQRAESHRQDSKLTHHRFIYLLVREYVFSGRIVDDQWSV